MPAGPDPVLTRRRLLQAAAGAVTLGGCASLPANLSGGHDVLRIGYVSPETGPLAPFGDADQYVTAVLSDHLRRNPVRIGGRTYQVEILKRDSQSSPARAADVAADLIFNQNIDLMLVAATSDTTDPVSDQCEASGMPCVATLTPWQPWYYGRGGGPQRSFEWTYLFFWGLEEVEWVYGDMWDKVATNRIAGGLWPTDQDGLSWGNPATGFPSAMSLLGYSVIDTGAYANGTGDFRRQIEVLRAAEAEVLVGVPQPPDFVTFWRQAVQGGYRPRVATIGKALLFPSTIEALGPSATNLSSEVSWSPSHPFTSSLTGQSAADLAAAYTETTGRQWAPPLGFAHALLEVAVAAFREAGAPRDRRAVAEALSGLSVRTVVGPLDWNMGPVPNVALTPLVGGQWRRGTDHPYELVIVSSRHPEIPAAGAMEPLPPALAG